MPHKHNHNHNHKKKQLSEDEIDEADNEENQDEMDDEAPKANLTKKKKKKHKKSHKHKQADEDSVELENGVREDDEVEYQTNSVDSDYNIIKATEANLPEPDDLDEVVKNNWIKPTVPVMGSTEDTSDNLNRRSSVAFNQIKYNAEGLNNDFEVTPWVPPSVELAKQYFEENVLKGGRASLFSVDMCKVQDCGNGIPLFFLFMKIFTFAFSIMALLSIPAMVFTTASLRTEYSDRDSLGLYKFTIGNLGYATDDPDYYSKTSCGSTGTVNSTCITAYGYTLTMEDVGQMITWFELAQVCVYFLAYLYFRYIANKLINSAAGRDCNISDYAIWIRNIPKDTTIERLISHFSNLYRLGTPDWRNRPPLYGAQPVRNVRNSGLDIHYNTWVAEATVFKKLGSYIRAFKAETQVIEELKRSRAFMKMYKEDTSHADGPNPKKYGKWEDKMLRLGSDLDSLTEQLMLYKKKQSTKNLFSSSGNVGAIPGVPGRRRSLAESLDAAAHCAFVVFNYSESRARCLEDYQGYSKFPWNLCYPAELKFRGSRVSVMAAPEPDEIIWENLEIPPRKKLFARIGSFIISFIFIVIGLAILIGAAGARRQLKSITPNLSMCKSEIPSLFERSYDWGSTKPVLVRPAVSGASNVLSRSAYDAKCAAIIPNSFYVMYADKGDLTKPIGKYDIDACYTSKVSASQTYYASNGPCPHYNQTTFCPCFSTTLRQTCQTLGCSVKSPLNFCGTFEADAMSGCYCSEALTKLVTDVISDPADAQNIYNSESQCTQFFETYAASLAGTYGAASSSAVINLILKRLIELTTRREYYDTTDVETGNIVKKVFVVTYFNMAIVVLLAFGYLKGGGRIAQMTNVLDGDYNDFTVSWYGQVGTFLIITFITNALGPWMVNIPKFLFLRPLRLWYTLPRVAKKKSHKIAMQADCNRLLTGREFDCTLHYAQLLAMMFFAMTYASGIPLFMPIIAATFIVYHFLNKLLILRHYKKPPHMGDGIHQMIMTLLPYAGIVRLAVGIWMFGNNEIIPSGIATVASIPGYSATGQEDPMTLYNQYLQDNRGDTSLSFIIVSRAVRANVLPLFIMFAILVILKVISVLLDYVPLYFIAENVGFLYIGISRCLGYKKDEYLGMTDKEGFVHAIDLVKLKHPLRNEMAAYTDVYMKYIKPALEKSPLWEKILNCHFGPFKLSEVDGEQGWSVILQDDWFVKVKTWKSNVQDEHMLHEQGSYKLTYEVVSDDGCFSYALDRIPAYQVAMKGLRENMDDYHYDKQNNLTKIDENDNIVEKFLREKNTKQKELHDKLADGAVRDKPQTAEKEVRSHRVLPADAKERYQQSKQFAKEATREHLYDDEDEEDYRATRRRDDDDASGDEEDQRHHRSHQSHQKKKHSHDKRRRQDDDEEEEETDYDYNKGVSGLV